MEILNVLCTMESSIEINSFEKRCNTAKKHQSLNKPILMQFSAKGLNKNSVHISER